MRPDAFRFAECRCYPDCKEGAGQTEGAKALALMHERVRQTDLTEKYFYRLVFVHSPGNDAAIVCTVQALLYVSLPVLNWWSCVLFHAALQ